MTLNELLPTRHGRNRIAVRRHEQNNPFGALEKSAGRFFEDFFRDFAIEPFGSFREWPQAFAPKIDISETENEVVVSAELPGVDKNDVEVSFDGGRLTIKGEKKHEKEVSEDNCRRMERSYGSFQRMLELPCEVDEEKSSAEFKNGILTVTLGKIVQEPEKVKKIEIKGS